MLSTPSRVSVVREAGKVAVPRVARESPKTDEKSRARLYPVELLGAFLERASMGRLGDLGMCLTLHQSARHPRGLAI
jgi:hypothetical protein